MPELVVDAAWDRVHGSIEARRISHAMNRPRISSESSIAQNFETLLVALREAHEGEVDELKTEIHRLRFEATCKNAGLLEADPHRNVQAVFGHAHYAEAKRHQEENRDADWEDNVDGVCSEYDSNGADCSDPYDLAMALAVEVAADRRAAAQGDLSQPLDLTNDAASASALLRGPIKKKAYLDAIGDSSTVMISNGQCSYYGEDRGSVLALGVRNTTTKNGEVAAYHVDGIEGLTPPLQSWINFLNGVLLCAREKKLFEIRRNWILTEEAMQRMMRLHPNLDMFCEDSVKRMRGSQSAAPPFASLRNAFLQSSPHRNSEHIQKIPMTPKFQKGRASYIPHMFVTREASIDKYKANTSFLPEKLRGCSLVIDPQSPYRIAWMTMGMMLMLYDLVVIPLNQAFQLKEHVFLRSMQWLGQLFWTVDILVSFFTGVYINNELVTDMRVIARVYSTTWLFFDLVVVVPLWMVEFMGSEETGGAEKSASVVKYIRLLRFLRIARLVKFEHYLQEALASVNSSTLLLCFGIAKLMVFIVLLNHIIACIWYMVGKRKSTGWAQKGEYLNAATYYKYLTSMHWAFTQFQGTSEVSPYLNMGVDSVERLYAVVTVMCALIILAWFVSMLTNMILQLQQLREERTGMQRRVRAYLSANNISLQLSLRVKKYMEWHQRTQRNLDGSQVTSILPIAMQMDLTDETRAPVLIANPFFKAMAHTHLRTFRAVCYELVRIVSPAPGELVFRPRDECHQMYFVAAGQMRYLPLPICAPLTEEFEATLRGHSPPDEVYRLERGHWLAEAVLWTHWEHCGGLIGIGDSSLFTILSHGDGSFSNLVSCLKKHHAAAHASAVLYARLFIAGLNHFGKNHNDFIDESTFEADFITEWGQGFTLAPMTHVPGQKIGKIPSDSTCTANTTQSFFVRHSG